MKPRGPLWRVGEGWDTHALVTGRKLMLGGVEIAHTHGLPGHSDADALCHAITDALFGAAALGDIGHHFPDTDVQYRGADSLALLSEAARRVKGAGWHVGNVDATVIAQAPKLAPHIAGDAPAHRRRARRRDRSGQRQGQDGRRHGPGRPRRIDGSARRLPALAAGLAPRVPGTAIGRRWSRDRLAVD